eukprot:m.233682 g.233682  ORF g.233682 m.233682 type:complete len:217 (-) comp19264_c0_seq1:149-799(-)
MGALFGKPAPPPQRAITTHDEAILKVKGQRDRLRQYQRKLEGTINKDRAAAKELGAAGQKDKALSLLKRNRYRTKLLGDTAGQLDNLEQLIESLEYATVESQVVAGLKAGNDALTALQKEMSVDDVAMLMEDSQESVARAEEISRMLAGKLTQEDTAAVEDDLSALVAQIEEQDTAAMLDSLPAVPTTIPAAAAAAAEDESVVAAKEKRAKVAVAS